MFRNWGKKLVQGAKAEIAEKPVQIFDSEAVQGAAELLIGIGILAIGVALMFRRNTPAPTINVYIQQ